MNPNDLISVVIPTCRRDARILKRAVQSALNQTHTAIELIVVDDSPEDFAGRDEVRRMLEGLGDNRVQYIRHETNQGACAARNTGIARARGGFLAFLDDDDEWLPDKLEKQLWLMNERGADYALIGCGSWTVDDATGLRRPRKPWPARGRVFDRLILENFIGSTSFPLMRKSCLTDVGPFDPLMKSAQDYELWLRIARNYPMDFVEEPLALYHVDGGARISTNVQSRIEGLERLNELHRDYLRAHPRALSARLDKLVPHYVRAGQREKARRAFFQALRLSPLAAQEHLSALRCLLGKPSVP